MAADFVIKRDDNLPLLKVTLTDGADTEIDVSEADSVTFRMRKASGAQGTHKVEAACDLFTDGEDGIVTYEWQDGDLDESGDFYGEFVIDFGGEIQTVPSDGYISIKVVDPL